MKINKDRYFNSFFNFFAFRILYAFESLRTSFFSFMISPTIIRENIRTRILINGIVSILNHLVFNCFFFSSCFNCQPSKTGKKNIITHPIKAPIVIRPSAIKFTTEDSILKRVYFIHITIQSEWYKSSHYLFFGFSF